VRYSLAGLKSRLDDDLDELLRVARLSDSGDAEATPTAEFCVVRLQDSWTRFVRDLVVRSALGNACRSGGARILPGPLGIMRQRSAMTTLRTNWPVGGTKPHYWEPKWFATKDSGRAVDVLQPTNGLDIKTALGAATNPIEDIRAVRNFIAHRGEPSASELDRKAHAWRPDWRQPADLVLNRPGAGLETRFEEWCRRLRLVGAAAVK
jgi:hypothetical protein